VGIIPLSEEDEFFKLTELLWVWHPISRIWTIVGGLSVSVWQETAERSKQNSWVLGLAWYLRHASGKDIVSVTHIFWVSHSVWSLGQLWDSRYGLRYSLYNVEGRCMVMDHVLPFHTLRKHC
jgi:hypothetical protein